MYRRITLEERGAPVAFDGHSSDVAAANCGALAPQPDLERTPRPPGGEADDQADQPPLVQILLPHGLFESAAYEEERLLAALR